jgi:hypothetical protein
MLHPKRSVDDRYPWLRDQDACNSSRRLPIAELTLVAQDSLAVQASIVDSAAERTSRLR